MNVIDVEISKLKPYEKNPRKNDKAVKYVQESIKQFGFKVPIVIDKNFTIIAGHTRFKAALNLNFQKVPCIVADDLTDEQIKAFRLADNKVSEKAEWDFDLLAGELEGLMNFDMESLGFEFADEEDERYTGKTDIPQYDPVGQKPDLSELVDEEKSEELIAEIKNSTLKEDEKEFLIKAAKRHMAFDYRKVAEYYANASPDMQGLMEKSALVIIDYDDAIKNGYARLSKRIEALQNA